LRRIATSGRLRPYERQLVSTRRIFLPNQFLILRFGFDFLVLTFPLFSTYESRTTNHRKKCKKVPKRYQNSINFCQFLQKSGEFLRKSRSFLLIFCNFFSPDPHFSLKNRDLYPDKIGDFL